MRNKKSAFNRSATAGLDAVATQSRIVITRQDSRLLLDFDSDVENETNSRAGIVLAEKAMPEVYPTCGLFSYSIDGRPANADSAVPAPVPYWSVFLPACISAGQQNWLPECALCWNEKPVGENKHKHPRVQVQSMAFQEFQEECVVEQKKLADSFVTVGK